MGEPGCAPRKAWVAVGLRNNRIVGVKVGVSVGPAGVAVTEGEGVTVGSSGVDEVVGGTSVRVSGIRGVAVAVSVEAFETATVSDPS